MTLIEQIIFGVSPWYNFILGVFDVWFGVFFAIHLFYIIKKWNIWKPKISRTVWGAISAALSVISILFALLNFSTWYNNIYTTL